MSTELHASREKPDEPILKGKLEDLPLADILQVLQVSSKTGGLFLTRSDGQSGMIVLRKGKIVQAAESASYRTLGDLLVEHGRITHSQLQQALTYMAPFPGMRVGDAIADLGFLSRGIIEDEVCGQLAEAIQQLMAWREADFEFRVGLVSSERQAPDFSTDFVFEKGVEPQTILAQVTSGAWAPNCGAKETAAENREREVEEEARLLALSLEEDRPAPESSDSEAARTAYEYLSLSEELFSTEERSEMGLLLLRYASELYSDGALLLCQPQGFKVLGQFGEPLSWGNSDARPSKSFYPREECPILDMVAVSRRPYAGLIRLTPEGLLVPAGNGVSDTVAGLITPIVVLGVCSLILVCRSALAGAPDARALVALARQVSVAFENLSLRDLTGRHHES